MNILDKELSIMKVQIHMNPFWYKGTEHTWRFSTIFDKGDNFYDLLFAFLHTNPLWKRVFSKREEFAPIGSKFFPF